MGHETSQLARFVVLLHEPAASLTRTDQTHWDWMFEVGDRLRTWSSAPVDSFQQPFELACDQLADHRLRYLDFVGEVSGNRGQVSRVIAGRFRVIDQSSDQFKVEVCWPSDDGHRAMLDFYRSLPDSRFRLVDNAVWRLRFAPGR